jgi:hypothetical protein
LPMVVARHGCHPCWLKEQKTEGRAIGAKRDPVFIKRRISGCVPRRSQ